MNDIGELLRCQGIDERTLAHAERRALDVEGYVILAKVIDTPCLPAMRAAFEQVVAGDRPDPRGRASGTRHAVDLLATTAAFDGVLTQPRVLAAVHHVLQRGFRVLTLGARDPLPGYGQQGLHTDWLPRPAGDPFRVVTVLWLLDDFTPFNGATRVIPGSHLFARPLPKAVQAPLSRHADERVIVANAGSALVFNGHLWHSGTRNQATVARRVVQCQFVARDSAPPDATVHGMLARLSPAARYLLGEGS